MSITLGTESVVVCPICLAAYATVEWVKDYYPLDGVYEYSFYVVCPNGCELTTDEEEQIEEQSASRYPVDFGKVDE